METLTEQDIDNLTKMEARLIRLRKREAANTNRLCADFTEVIEKIHYIRQMLQARMGIPVDKNIEQTERDFEALLNRIMAARS